MVDNKVEGKIVEQTPWVRKYGKERKQTKALERAERDVKIVELKLQNNTQQEIAKLLDIPQSTVSATIERFKPAFKNVDRINDFRSVKSDLLSAAQLCALESAMSPTKLAKAGFLSTLQGFDILNKAERLESGKSTENFAHSVFGRIQLTSGSNDSDK